jgi:hypothetical protein
MLLAAKADPARCEHIGCNALAMAGIGGNVAAFDLLMARNPALWHQRNSLGMLPFAYLPMYGHEAAMRHVLKVYPELAASALVDTRGPGSSMATCVLGIAPTRLKRLSERPPPDV